LNAGHLRARRLSKRCGGPNGRGVWLEAIRARPIRVWSAVLFDRNLPKGGGAIRGIGEKFAANPVTGTGSMSVPIATSPGRSGFEPQLALSYDSGAGNGCGSCGSGSLGRPASEPGRFMSRGRGPRGGCPPPEGVDVAYPLKEAQALK
jgi:hypothetical protein